jgi:hypothetical protein
VSTTGPITSPARPSTLKPRPQDGRVRERFGQHEPPAVCGREAQQQRVRLAQQCPAGEYQRREHEHRDREDRSTRVLAYAARQPGVEGGLERPARDRGHAGRQQGFDKAMHDDRTPTFL